MRCCFLFALTACGEAHQLASVVDDAAVMLDGPYDTAPVSFDSVIDAVGATRDASVDAATLDALPDASVDAATLDALPDALPPAPTCVSTVTLSSVGGSGEATWTCRGTQPASWHLKIESREGVLVNQLSGTPCPGGSAFISFAYKTSSEPVISLNRLELADGTTVLCSAP